MSWFEDQLKKVGTAVTEHIEGVGEGAVAGLLGQISPTSAGGTTTGETATGRKIVQATPTGMGPQADAAAAASGMPSWVKPVGIGLAVAAAAALVWKFTAGGR